MTPTTLTSRPTTMRPNKLALLVLVASCYRTAREPAIDQRLARIEQRLDAQDKAIADARTRSNSTELSLLAQQNAELSRKVDELTERLAKSPAPSRPTARREPDKNLVYSVPVGSSPQLGPANAKVTMVMAFEFACPFCQRAWATVDALRTKYGKDLRVVYKQRIVHAKTATTPALGACAANKQGKWRKFADLTWTKAFEARDFEEANIDAIARQVGVNMKKFKGDVAGACTQELADEQALMQKLAINATPSFFINGRYMAGAQPQGAFEALIDEELAKATNSGVKPDRYYEDEIVGKGLKDVP